MQFRARRRSLAKCWSYARIARRSGCFHPARWAPWRCLAATRLIYGVFLRPLECSFDGMRLFVGCFTFLLAGGLIAQVATQKDAASTKEIMTAMTIPASNALFAVPEKPTDKDWSEMRKQALILSDSATRLLAPGRVKAKSDNPADWNKAATSMRNAAQMALKAIDKKDTDLLSGDVGESILNSCSACHERYLPK